MWKDYRGIRYRSQGIDNRGVSRISIVIEFVWLYPVENNQGKI